MKFTAAIGVAALFMAPSAAAWKLPHANKADAATPTGYPSSGFPSGTPSGTPSVTPSGTPSVTPSGTPSVTPSGTPSGTPTGSPTGFSFGRRDPAHGPGLKGPGHGGPGYGGFGHGGHGHGSESSSFSTISPTSSPIGSSTAVPSGFPESTGVPPGFPGGFSGSQTSSGSFTVLPVATATAATVGEQGDFTRRHARHMLF